MKRCAAELGFNTKEQMLSLRDLDPGEFYAYGPAISKTVQKVKIGAVQTTHPDSSKMGAKIGVKVVPASAKVKKALAALADLPQEVEEEANTMKALQEQLRAAKGEITALRKVKEPIPHPVAQVDLTAIKNQVAKRDKEWARVVDGWASYAGRLVGRLMRVGDMIRNELEKEPPKTLPEFIMPTVKSDSVAKTTGNSGDTRDRTPLRASGMTYDKVYSADPVLGKELPEGERKILIAIAGTPAGMSRTELTLLTGYRRSTRNAYIQRLAQKGYVQISGEIVKPTQEGIDALGSDYEPLPVGRDLLEHYLKTLPDGERRVLQVVNDAQTAVSRNYISDVTKYQKSTRNAYIQRLVARKILRIPAPEMVELSESLHD